MNLILVLRSEFICLMSLLLLLWYASIHGSYDNIKRYKLLNILAIGHVIFDIITVITVNNLDTVPPLVNRICHVIFYYFAILYCYVLLDFVVEIIYGERSRNGRIIGQPIMADLNLRFCITIFTIMSTSQSVCIQTGRIMTFLAFVVLYGMIKVLILSWHIDLVVYRKGYEPIQFFLPHCPVGEILV